MELLDFLVLPILFILCVIFFRKVFADIDRPHREACARDLEKILGGKTEAWKRIYGDLGEYKYPPPKDL